KSKGSVPMNIPLPDLFGLMEATSYLGATRAGFWARASGVAGAGAVCADAAATKRINRHRGREKPFISPSGTKRQSLSLFKQDPYGRFFVHHYYYVLRAIGLTRLFDAQNSKIVPMGYTCRTIQKKALACIIESSLEGCY